MYCSAMGIVAEWTRAATESPQPFDLGHSVACSFTASYPSHYLLVVSLPHVSQGAFLVGMMNMHAVEELNASGPATESPSGRSTLRKGIRAVCL